MESEYISEEILKYFDKYFASEPIDGANRRILVWYDENGQNSNNIDSLETDKLAVFQFKNNPMKLEYEIQKLEPGKNVLIYVDSKPDFSLKNPLIAIEAANPNCIFVPDEVNMILKNLGLGLDYRSTVEANKRFFNNKKRSEKLSEFMNEVHSPDDLTRAFIAANFNADSTRLDRVLVALFRAYSENTENFKYIDSKAVNLLLADYFSYKAANIEKMDELLESVIISYFVFSLDEVSSIPRLRNLTLPRESAANVNLFIHDIRNDKSTESYFYELSDKIAKKFEVRDILEQLPLESYIDSDAFTDIDESIIDKLLIKLDNNDSVANDLKSRRTKDLRASIRNSYDMIDFADKTLSEIGKNLTSIVESDRDNLTKLYAEKLYKIDYYYRKFYQFYDKTNQADKYRKLAEHVENIYNGEYTARLAEKWSDSISEMDWNGGNTQLQQNFYEKNLAVLDDKRDRVFVIISDAMRYEVAAELSEELRKSGANVTLEPMVGVIPSYTQLGMAALLPHKSLNINSENYQVSSESISTAGVNNRDKILKSANENNMAIKYEDLKKLRKTDWKTTFAGKKYVYIYHDVIDKAGEHDESAVFAACEKAISEIKQLINDLHTTFSGTSVFVTSDHGFYYRRSDIVRFNDGDSENKKKDRFAVSDTPGDPADVLSFKMSYINEEDQRYVRLPRGDMIYSKRGTSGNYIHGGAMPQEVIVPKLSFKSTRNTNDLPKVKILYNGISTKITNSITFLNFVQDEPVSNDRTGARYRVYFTDDKNERISDEVTIIADSTEKDLSNRTFREKFTFASREYDKNATYHMKIEDATTNSEIDDINFKIDIMMSLL